MGKEWRHGWLWMGRGVRGCGKEARRSGGGAIGAAGARRVRWGIGRAWGHLSARECVVHQQNHARAEPRGGVALTGFLGVEKRENVAWFFIYGHQKYGAFIRLVGFPVSTSWASVTNWSPNLKNPSTRLEPERVS
jgi:hypothetical protein